MKKIKTFQTFNDGFDKIYQVPFRIYDTKGTLDDAEDDEPVMVAIFSYTDSTYWGIWDEFDCPWTANPAYESNWIYAWNFREGKTYVDLENAYNDQQQNPDLP